jgi:hypothetical protein
MHWDDGGRGVRRHDDLPGMKIVRAEFGFYFRDGYGDQGDDAERRQAEVDVYVRQQAALRCSAPSAGTLVAPPLR